MEGEVALRVRTNRPASVLDASAAAVVLAGVAAAAGLALCESRRRPPRRIPRDAPSRRLNGAAALLSASVLADSAVEHYRGGFQNPAMVAPIITAALSLAAGVDGATRKGGPQARRLRDAAYTLAGVVGAAGLAFHLFNIGKRPGRFDWLNFFYAAPVGAPAALTLAGLIGCAGEILRTERAARVGRRRWGRILAGLSSLGLAGTVGEAGLLHFRGAFQNPFMWLPVSLPPVAAALTAKAAAADPRRRPWLTRAWLWLTAGLGLGGVGFHAFGLSRRMGGWRNWSQNLLAGPPLPAPPAFSALALAALAALDLIEEPRR
jgi:hypothetical protein